MAQAAVNRDHDRPASGRITQPRNYPGTGVGTLAAGAMIGTSAGYVAAAAREDDVAAAAGVPLVAWVSFATLLAEEIWRRNDR